MYYNSNDISSESVRNSKRESHGLQTCFLFTAKSKTWHCDRSHVHPLVHQIGITHLTALMRIKHVVDRRSHVL